MITEAEKFERDNIITINPNTSPKVFKSIQDITDAEFGDIFADKILGATDDVIIAPDLGSALVDEAASAVALVEHDSVIGYSYAVDIAKFDPVRSVEQGKTAYLYLTVLDKNFRGKGKVGFLTDELFRNLLKKGYTHVERDCKTISKDGNEGYADNVQRHYSDLPGAIEYISEDRVRFEDVGPERLFRMNSAKSLARHYY